MLLFSLDTLNPSTRILSGSFFVCLWQVATNNSICSTGAMKIIMIGVFIGKTVSNVLHYCFIKDQIPKTSSACHYLLRRPWTEILEVVER